MTKVLPKAMIAGGFHQDRAQAKAFFDAYVQGWKDLQASLPVTAQRSPYDQHPPAAAPEFTPLTPEPQASPTPPATPQPPTQTSSLPESSEVESTQVDIPPPVVEGLTGHEESVPDAPISESVPKKQRRRGLPRSLRRTKKKAAGSHIETKED